MFSSRAESFGPPPDVVGPDTAVVEGIVVEENVEENWRKQRVAKTTPKKPPGKECSIRFLRNISGVTLREWSLEEEELCENSWWNIHSRSYGDPIFVVCSRDVL